MTEDLIRYDVLAQDALRGVIRTVLKGAAQDGLPGEHHFYITFQTNAPGVRLSERMREQYPDEMTIVLQHQYWDLDVTEHGFSVGLAFNSVPERLLIPFSAITRFFDPSVQFGLEFEVDSGEDEGDLTDEETGSVATTGIEAETPVAEADDETEEPEGADVVSLDAFRKKK